MIGPYWFWLRAALTAHDWGHPRARSGTPCAPVVGPGRNGTWVTGKQSLVAFGGNQSFLCEYVAGPVVGSALGAQSSLASSVFLAEADDVPTLALRVR